MNNQTQLKIVETGDFEEDLQPTIHKLANSRELFDLYRLTYDCYSAVGHRLNNLDGLWIPHPEFDHAADTTILMAELEGEIVGTISITMDGPQGLPLDKRFSNTCALMRSSGRRLAQVWRLLVKESCPIKPSITTLLVTEAVQHLLAQGAQTSLFMVQDEYIDACCDLFNPIVLAGIPSAPGLSQSKSVLFRVESEKLKVTMPTQGGPHEPIAHLSCR